MTSHAIDRAPMEPAAVKNLGAVFTKRWIVDLILDLAEYTPDKDLAGLQVVEPSVGHGAFLTAIAERLVESCRLHGRAVTDAFDSVLGFDIDELAVEACRSNVMTVLERAGVETDDARALATRWVALGDFLKLAVDLPSVDLVVGNPPYVRIEDVDKDSMASYRSDWTTMSGRADLYVGFIEAALSLVDDEGKVAFICADRWMRNKYGSALRTLIEEKYSFDTCVVVHDVEAFEDNVAAYPAISVFRAGAQGPALVCEAAYSFGPSAAQRLLDVWRRGPRPIKPDDDFKISWMPSWFRGAQSWPAGHPELLARLTDLESRLPTLEQVGVKISVGVATGSDKTFVRADVDGIEPDLLLPALSAREVASGRIEWSGRYLVNPWGDDRRPIDPSEHPGFNRFITKHRTALKDRFVARSHPTVWWRTIDRVDRGVASRAKLLVPDLKDRVHPVLDTGEFYPMHSLYYLTSDTWDLEVLGGLLLSDLANMFVEAYSVRMASGYMRVSAQYLRRIRVPEPQGLDPDLIDQLRAAFRSRDINRANELAAVAYGPQR